MRKTGPRRFVPSDFSHASTVSCPNGSVSALAALFTTMSSRPNSSTVRSTSALTASTSPICVGMPIASPPNARRCASVVGARIRLAAGHRDLGAGRGKALGDGQPDPSRASGDDRHPAGQVVQVLQLLAIHGHPFHSGTTLLYYRHPRAANPRGTP